MVAPHNGKLNCVGIIMDNSIKDLKTNAWMSPSGLTRVRKHEYGYKANAYNGYKELYFWDGPHRGQQLKVIRDSEFGSYQR